MASLSSRRVSRSFKSDESVVETKEFEDDALDTTGSVVETKEFEDDALDTTRSSLLRKALFSCVYSSVAVLNNPEETSSYLLRRRCSLLPLLF